MIALRYCCPACAGEVERRGTAYVCVACSRDYPILFGIPDFRLRSDRYLSLEDERAKAAVLYRAAESRTFEQLLAYYYEITNDVTVVRARRFSGYVLRGPQRAELAFERLGPIKGEDVLLDVGCGAGGALIGGDGRFGRVVGMDIALRWLVICRKWLEAAGVQADLVCADATSPPFATAQFSHVLAMDTMEHVEDPSAVLLALRRQMRQGGRLWLSANNRHWLGPHPAVGVWAAAYRPAWSRRVREGHEAYDPLRFTAMLSPAGMRRSCEHAGLKPIGVWPRRVEGDGLRAFYAQLAESKIVAPLLTAFGPAFELVAEARGEA